MKTYNAGRLSGLLVLVIVIFVCIFMSQPSTAQFINPHFIFWPFQQSVSPVISLSPVVPFFSQPWLNPVLSTPAIYGLPSPLQNPVARIAGTTTIFLPPSAITDIKVIIKPPDVDTIKLEELVAPFTIYLYPEGYSPEARLLSAIIAGGLLPFYPF
ncbi:hypothetical protein JXL19_11655 [bacterium]|nr:hypothetical protein [bacterium]